MHSSLFCLDIWDSKLFIHLTESFFSVFPLCFPELGGREIDDIKWWFGRQQTSPFSHNYLMMLLRSCSCVWVPLLCCLISNPRLSISKWEEFVVRPVSPYMFTWCAFTKSKVVWYKSIQCNRRGGDCGRNGCLFWTSKLGGGFFKGDRSLVSKKLLKFSFI